MKKTAQVTPSSRALSDRGFTLVEVMVAVVIVSVALIPSILTIQRVRLHARSTSYNLVGMNLAVAMTELVKRSGYNEIAYNQPMPDILGVDDVPNPLLDFPRSNKLGTETDFANLQAGIAGGATDSQLDAFVAGVRSGSPNRNSPVVTSDTNYLFFSPDQVAAINGYADFDSVPEEEQAQLLNPGFAWGIAITDADPGQAIGGGFMNTGLRKITVIVKWTDVQRGLIDFAVIETVVAEMAPRM
jgi:prepilin-type N-terminal cleavage/methylation domain-containing protein